MLKYEGNLNCEIFLKMKSLTSSFYNVKDLNQK